MHPLQWFLKDHWRRGEQIRCQLNFKVMVTRALFKDLAWWEVESNLSLGMLLAALQHMVTITTCANMEDWGGHARVLRTHASLFHGFGQLRNGSSITLFYNFA